MQFSVITSRLCRCMAAQTLLAALAVLLLLAWPGAPATALIVEGLGPGYITTVAGSGENNPLDGGPADRVMFDPGPQRIAVDQKGNLYITTYTTIGTGSRVFLMAAADDERFGISMRKGHIYHIAGNGSNTFESSYDGRPATEAGMCPRDITLDSAGNIYLSNGATTPYRVLKINTADGTIGTVVGGGSDTISNGIGANNVRLSSLYNVSVDNKNNVFLSSTGNSTKNIYMIPAASGSYYGRDMEAECIYQVNADNEEGTSFPSYNRATVDGEGNIYYYSHSSSGFIFSKNTYTNTLGGNHTVIADATGTDYWPRATSTGAINYLTADSDGNVYISFTTNSHSVFQITPTGAVNRVAGSGVASYSGDGEPGTLAQLSSPNGLALDQEGNLYIADTGNRRVRYVQLSPVAEPELTGLTISLEQLLTYEGGEKEYSLAEIFDLKGFDQYGYKFDISGKDVTWTVLSGPAQIEGDALVVTGGGRVEIVSRVEGIQSEPLEFFISDGSPELTGLDLSGSPSLIYGGSPFDYDLNDLILTGWDQYKESIDFDRQSVSWAVYAGSDIGFVDGNRLRIKGAGMLSVCAQVYDVRSNNLELVVKKAPPTLIADAVNDLAGSTQIITFPDDPAWRAAITKVSANGSELKGWNPFYDIEAGKIIIPPNFYMRYGGDYLITVEAAGYADISVVQTLYSLLIDGDGVSNPLKFTQSQLLSMPQYDHKYSVINTYSTKKWYLGEGVLLRELLKAAGIRDTAQLLRFTSSDNFVVRLTVQELLNDKRYYFPGLMDNDPNAGYNAGSSQGKEAVEPILALRSTDGDNPSYLSSNETPHLIFGQRVVTEQTNDAFSKYVSHIEVLTDKPTQCGAPTATVPSGEVLPGTEVELKNDDMDNTKIYYTTDGSTPTVESKLYNNIAERWLSSFTEEEIRKINAPVLIMDNTVLQTISIGHGKADSEVVTFTYTVSGLAVPPVLTAAGDGTNILGQDVRLTFADDQAWRETVSDVQVDGKSIAERYTVSAGVITINADVFTVATDYTITISAAGYNTATVNQRLMAGTPEPVSLMVQPATIVQGHLSYIHVTYSGAALQEASFALLDKNGDIIDSAVQGTKGKAIITVTAPSEPGIYDVVALLEGEQLAGDTIEVVAYNDNIWETYTSVNENGFVVINFNEDITTKNNSLTVNGKKATGRIVGGRSIVTSVNIESMPEGESLFSVPGVKYPRLYPGYVFTFPATITK